MIIDTSVVYTAAAMIALLAAAASGLYVLIIKPGRKITQISEIISDFRDDWFGTDDRPGVPGRPGVMVRLRKIEEQLWPNHGASVRDAVDRLEGALRRVEDTLAVLLDQRRERP